jgi:hypothetical protein
MTDMIDVSIDTDEAYPVYFMHKADGDFWKSTGQVPADVYDRWTQVVEEYNHVQTEMASFLCLSLYGEHTFISLEPDRGAKRTYCKRCYTVKGETQWA